MRVRIFYAKNGQDLGFGTYFLILLREGESALAHSAPPVRATTCNHTKKQSSLTYCNMKNLNK